ncbi:MAG: helix-turn-helix transcriptional regulator, partial [Rothia sp. (in: high G+C Gram-positive bacteria)]|nr:helix-turn-helix transcriptional regulator [Rothia sp. (in: high G+C Gram-positive bacteria)]
TNQEIADDLKYSLSNIKNTLTRIYQKMGVTTRTQLLVHAGHHNFPVLDDKENLTFFKSQVIPAGTAPLYSIKST